MTGQYLWFSWPTKLQSCTIDSAESPVWVDVRLVQQQPMSMLRSPVALPPSPHTQNPPGRVVRQRLVPFRCHFNPVKSLMATKTKHFTTNDGVQLAYETAGSSGPVIVLIHGWSGSRKYFQRNITHLAANCKVCRG